MTDYIFNEVVYEDTRGGQVRLLAEDHFKSAVTLEIRKVGSYQTVTESIRINVEDLDMFMSNMTEGIKRALDMKERMAASDHLQSQARG